MCACVVLVQCACDDIDTSACQLMAQQQNMCSNTDLAMSACPRFCKLCPLECYHCTATVQDFHMCNTTMICPDGQVCMRKELKSVFDGHHEYQLTCEDKQACDGLNLQVAFGKREIETRDITVSCCSEDLCNYPETTTLPAPTTLPPTTASHSSTCDIDLIMVVDESSSLARHESDVKGFLQDVVSKLPISDSGTHVSLGTFSLSAVEQFDLNDHTSPATVSHAISRIQFAGGAADMNVGLKYAVNQAMTPSAGDRPGSKNVVLILTDDGTHSPSQLRALENQVHSLSDDVIAVNIGRIQFAHLSTDAGHLFHLTRTSTLDTITGQVVNLICPQLNNHHYRTTAYP